LSRTSFHMAGFEVATEASNRGEMGTEHSPLSPSRPFPSTWIKENPGVWDNALRNNCGADSAPFPGETLNADPPSAGTLGQRRSSQSDFGIPIRISEFPFGFRNSHLAFAVCGYRLPILQQE